MKKPEAVEENVTLPAVRTRKAGDVAKNPSRAEAVADSVQQKAHRYRRALGDVFRYILAFARLLRSYARRQYVNIPWKSVVLIVGAMLYFLAPLDAVPDFLLGGFVDDVAIVTAVLRQVRNDLDAFLAWERDGSFPQKST